MIFDKVGFWSNHIESFSLTMLSTIILTSDETSLSFVWEENLGSGIFAEITHVRPSLISSPEIVNLFFFNKLCSVAYLLITLVSALTRVINKYATEHNLLKKNKLTISGDDIKEGLTCVISAKIPDPKFSSQTKDKLVSSEVRMIVESIVSEKLSIWFDQNPTLSKIILAKVMHYFS